MPSRSLHLGADGHRRDHGVTVVTVPLLALPVTAGTALEVDVMTEVGQVADLPAGTQDHVAAATAVAAVGAALGDVLLAAQTDTAGAAATATDVDRRVIGQHREPSGGRRERCVRTRE